MRGMLSRRRLPAALVLVLFWYSLTASAAAPLNPAQPGLAPPWVRATRVASAPVRCVGTLFYLRANTLQRSGWPKLIVSLDLTRADRCAGRFGQPVGRLHGFFVMTRDRLSVRTHLRASSNSYWLSLCRQVRPDCLDINTVIRWVPARGAP
jgi:hypothetical protein